ncbi:hypothetical protein CPB84DRAFT_1852405 [Gymnopilus junonius]|uniref:Uncharacterized protein n=1 Tax=Gymnopilus junonius TaxID=109634 RepID=A0A9P5NDF0_GYMJU|nr:hypothetical protein CPB84DRAFT_1852405 [Gymnopilus junonius]
MRLFSSFLVGFYLIATLVSALAVINPVGNDVKQFSDGELLSPRGDVSPSVEILERSPLSLTTAAVNLTPEQQALIKEAQANGVKITAANVLNIWRTTLTIQGITAKIFFLEKGNANAGMQHIWQRHSAEFTAKGITEAEIPNLVQQATTSGPPLDLVVAITIGSNGFIGAEEEGCLSEGEEGALADIAAN